MNSSAWVGLAGFSIEQFWTGPGRGQEVPSEQVSKDLGLRMRLRPEFPK